MFLNHRWLIFLFVILFGVIIFAQNGLDENTKKLVIELLNRSANKTYLIELLSGSTDNDTLAKIVDEYPAESVGIIYKDYTFEQIQALEDELQGREHFIYDPIKEKTILIKKDFERACENYSNTGDIVVFEENFLTTGYEIVSMQKLILRIINNKVEEKLKPTFLSHRQQRADPNNDPRRPSRPRRTVFQYLSSLFFGIRGPDHFGPVNQMWSLLRTLDQETNLINPAIPGASYINWGYERLRTLVLRLRRVYATYRLASYSSASSWIRTRFLQPYEYQATLGLVDLVGYRRLTTPLSSALMHQFRFWLNLIAGNVEVNLFSRPANSQTSNIDPQALQILLKTLQHNEKRQKDQIGQNRLNEMIENLAKNQMKQQEQIDRILSNLGKNPMAHHSKHSITSTTTTTTTTEKPKKHSTTTERPTTEKHKHKEHGETMVQLKRQRKLLNELIQELQKPINDSTSGGKHTFERIDHAQKTLMNVMQAVTPLINMMAQKNLVSSDTVQKSKLDLLSIVNSVNNRELNEIDNGNENNGGEEIFHFRQLGEKLQDVLDDIITEANHNNPDPDGHETSFRLLKNSILQVVASENDDALKSIHNRIIA